MVDRDLKDDEDIKMMTLKIADFGTATEEKIFDKMSGTRIYSNTKYSCLWIIKFFIEFNNSLLYMAPE